MAINGTEVEMRLAEDKELLSAAPDSVPHSDCQIDAATTLEIENTRLATDLKSHARRSTGAED